MSDYKNWLVEQTLPQTGFDRVVFEESLRYGLESQLEELTAINESEVIQALTESSYEDILSLYLSEDIITEADTQRGESKLRSLLKVGLAALAGGAAIGAKAVKTGMDQGEVNHYGTKLMKGFLGGSGSKAVASKGAFMAKGAASAVGASAGTIVGGAMLAAVIYYAYKRYNEPCRRKCNAGMGTNSKPARLCMAKCELIAQTKIVQQIKNDMGKCGKTTDPAKCKVKLSKELANWTNKVNKSKAKITKIQRTP